MKDIDDTLTFTNTVDIVPEKVCVENLNEICADWHKAFVSQFSGIPLRVDESLKGGQYFVAVSQELYEQLIKTPKAELPTPVDPPRPKGGIKQWA